MAMFNNPDIVYSLGLQNIHINHIYLVGSRLWGTHTEASDIDLLLVVDGMPPKILRSQHRNQYDATILTKEEFAARLQSGSLVETVCCLLNHGNERESLKILLPTIEVLDTWINYRHSVDREKAKKFWLKGKRSDGFKILQHMILAESVRRGLHRKVLDAGGRGLDGISLSLAELHGFVRSGRHDRDSSWLRLEWQDVEELHTARLQKIQVRSALLKATLD